MKTALLTCLFILLFTSVSGQQTNSPSLELDDEWSGNDLLINAITYSPGSYTLLLLFSELTNSSHPLVSSYVVQGSKNLLTIRPLNEENPLRYNYKYFYERGHKSKKTDTTFVYRLPYSEFKTEPVSYQYLYNIQERYFGADNHQNWSSIRFSLHEGDTIFAMRKGLVVKIEDLYYPAEKGVDVSFSTRRNYILVEHEDGTICFYSPMKKDDFMVKEGEVVFPGTPLGKAGKFNQEDPDCMISITVSYPEINSEKQIANNKPPFIRHYYNPVFATSDGNMKLVERKSYKAVSSHELIEKEMSKKEKKKYSKR